eukprot:4296804-Prymnesium_polylepis.1
MVGGWGEPVILAQGPGYQVGVVWGNEEGICITPRGGHASAGTPEGPALRQAHHRRCHAPLRSRAGADLGR